MLSDLERKVLSIIYNYTTSHGRYPTMERVELITGRRRPAIYAALDKLAEKQFIRWDGKRLESVEIQQAREDDSIYGRKRRR